MTRTFGAARPARLVTATGTPGAFPRPSTDYATGSVIAPKTWGQRSWYPYRTPAASAASRGELVAFGDSTLHGAGGLYSLLQRIRDRAVTAGLTDGGKGFITSAESEIGYDAPEVNAQVTRVGFSNLPDNWDASGNGFYWDDGTTANATLSLQFRTTTCRLWYYATGSSGQFQYRIDGGSWITFDAYTPAGIASKFLYLTGFTANTTHTIDIQNLASTPQNASAKWCRVTIAPMNNTGLAMQKFAVTGQTMNNFNFPWRYWNALGLTAPGGPQDQAASYIIDTSPAAPGRVKPVLAWLQLGFNDLTGAGAGAAALAATGVSYFAAACQAAGIDGVIVSGQLPYNANWPANGASLFTTMRDTAKAAGLAWVDLFTPIGGPSQSYSGGVNNPHLTKTQYQAQADWIWDNLLGL